VTWILYCMVVQRPLCCDCYMQSALAHVPALLATCAVWFLGCGSWYRGPWGRRQGIGGFDLQHCRRVQAGAGWRGCCCGTHIASRVLWLANPAALCCGHNGSLPLVRSAAQLLEDMRQGVAGVVRRCCWLSCVSDHQAQRSYCTTAAASWPAFRACHRQSALVHVPAVFATCISYCLFVCGTTG
jgi:hypothetical protein